MNLCADTSAHQDMCLLQVSVICEHQTWSYSEADSIYYDSNHINLLHEWANEIKKNQRDSKMIDINIYLHKPASY